MKATEQYFLVVLFIKLYKVFLTFESVNEIQMKAIEEYFPVVLSSTVFAGCYAIQGGSIFESMDFSVTIQMAFLWRRLSHCTRWF